MIATTALPTEAQVRQYMTANITDHVDPLTGEINLTGMVEDAMMHFNLYNTVLDDPEGEIWDWAFEEADEYQPQ